MLSKEVPDLQEGLNSGKYVTTIQEKGSLEILESEEKIGWVVDVENSLEYSDFEVESNDSIAGQ